MRLDIKAFHCVLLFCQSHSIVIYKVVLGREMGGEQSCLTVFSDDRKLPSLHALPL